MNKILLIIGGIVVILGVLLSFYLDLFAWYIMIINGTEQWFNAMGGRNEMQIPDPIVITTFLPGNLAVIGVVIAWIGRTKKSAFIGFLLVFAGISLFIVNILGYTGAYVDYGDGIITWKEWADYISNNLHSNVLWGQNEDGTIVFRLGYGLITTGIGGLLMGLSAITSKED